MTGMIFDIKRCALHDGPGIRTTVFFKGCPMRCIWCHNPEGISPAPELMYFAYRCIHCEQCVEVCPLNIISFQNGVLSINRALCTGCGICAEVCPGNALELIGRRYSSTALFEIIMRDKAYFDNSTGGVTFSGGEPMAQPDFLNEILSLCHNHGIHTAVDTAGFVPGDAFKKNMALIDIFLFDLKILAPEVHKRYTGVKPEPIIENFKFIGKHCKDKEIVVRFPVIPGITDTEQNVDEIAGLVGSFENIKKIDLLPFHNVCEKYKHLNQLYKIPAQLCIEEARLMEIKEKFNARGFNVKIGG